MTTMYKLVLFVCVLKCLEFQIEGFLFGTVDSCRGRCKAGYSSSHECQCNKQCVGLGDCCQDYNALCVAPLNSCQGRCHAGYSSSHGCQCNKQCVGLGDCCPDYNAVCIATQPAKSGQCQTLSQMSTTLWSNDVNRLESSDVTTNYQIHVTDVSTQDSQSRFFTKVSESKLTSPTYSAFLNLLDNYYPQHDSTEHTTSHETQEIDAFLDAVLDTKVMAQLLNFLICQSKVQTKADLKAMLKKIWFDFYRRGSNDAYNSSSGFEHIFVGEYKDSKTVNGFHSWLSFYQKEKAGKINYLGFVSRGSPDIIGAAFTWNGHLKTKTTFFVGTSPEFDLAIYTLCYVMRPNDVCPLTLVNHSVSIKTFDTNGHIATAFIMI